MTWIHVCVYMYLSKDKITGLLIGCCFLVAGRLGRQRTICSMLLRLVVLSKSRDMDLNQTRHHHRYNHRLRWCVLIKILIFNDENVFSEKNVNEYKPKYKILLNFLRTCIYINIIFLGGWIGVEDKLGGGGYMRNFYKVLTNGIVGHMGYIPLFWLTKIDIRWCGFTRSVSGFFYSPQTPP